MEITGFIARNFMGLREYKLPTKGRIIEVSGKNGSGKSSVLEGVKTILGGGNIMALRNIHAPDGEDPELVLELDDGAFTARREGDSPVVVKERVKDADGHDTAATKRVKSPQAFLDGLYDAESAKASSPLELLKGTMRDRINWILAALPITLQPGALLETVGDALWPIVESVAQKGGHPLQVISAAHEKLYEERRGVNVSKTDKERTVRELEMTLPARMPTPPAEVEALQKERDELALSITQARQRADGIHRAALAETKGDLDAGAARSREDAATSIGARRQVLDLEIARLTAECQKDVDTYNTVMQATIDALRDKATAGRVAAEEARAGEHARIDGEQVKLDEITKRLAAARAAADESVKLRERVAIVDRIRGEAVTLTGKSEALSAALASLETLKSRLLTALPIAGLEITESEIRVNGVRFDQLNKAQRIRLAVQVASLRAKERLLPILFVDDAEMLDEDEREILKTEVLESGCYAFMAVVRRGQPLETQVTS